MNLQISRIPANIYMQYVQLKAYVTQAGTGGNNEVTLHHLSHNNTYYENNITSCLGNCQFWTDMGDGASYAAMNITTGYNRFNLNPSIIDLNASLGTQSWFGYGFVSHTGENITLHGNQDAKMAGRDFALSDQRPLLNITYITNPANESDGRIAIEQGIYNTINTSINTGQQVYFTNATANTHSLNKFDKYTQKLNQSWAFNYVTEGESFTNLPGWVNRLIVWENNTLTTDQITAQVTGTVTNTTS